MRHLLEFIQELELKNHPLAGGSFTWSGGLNDQFASRLVDCFLVIEGWENHSSGLT